MTAEIDRGYLIHDFIITEDYVVLVICPATFDLSRIAQGANTLSWEPDRGTRIAVIPRNGQNRQIRWIETDAFWCWHYANAWHEGGEIVTVFPWWNHLNFAIPGLPPLEGRLTRAWIDNKLGSMSTAEHGASRIWWDLVSTPESNIKSAVCTHARQPWCIIRPK